MTSAYLTDGLGFPGIPCPKCTGRGHIAAYHNHFGGVCFRCNGAQVIPPTAGIRKAAVAARQMLRNDQDTDFHASVGYRPGSGEVTRTATGLAAGMAIRRRSRERDADGNLVNTNPWRTVASVRSTALVTGTALAGGDEIVWVSWSLETVVTFTDGSVARIHSESWESQPRPEVLGRVAEMAARARASYERTLARRAGMPGAALASGGG